MAENPPEPTADTFGLDSSTIGCHPYRKFDRQCKCRTRHTQSQRTLASMRRELAVEEISLYISRTNADRYEITKVPAGFLINRNGGKVLRKLWKNTCETEA